MKIEIKGDKLHLLRRERIPRLPAQKITQDGFQIALVGKFQQKLGIPAQYTPDTLDGQSGLRHVMQRAYHGRPVKQAVHKWKFIDIRGDIKVARVIPQAFARLQQLRAGVIQQDDAFETGIARGVAAGSGAQFQQELAGFGQQALERDLFDGVFVAAFAGIPEGALIIRAFVGTNGWGIGRVCVHA